MLMASMSEHGKALPPGGENDNIRLPDIGAHITRDAEVFENTFPFPSLDRFKRDSAPGAFGSTQKLETGIGIPFLYQTCRFRIFIQSLGFKKPSHKKECKGGFGKRCHGKLVRVHSRTFGHDDMAPRGRQCQSETSGHRPYSERTRHR